LCDVYIALERLAPCNAEVPISPCSANYRLGGNGHLHRFHLVCVILPLPWQLRLIYNSDKLHSTLTSSLIRIQY